MDILEPSEMLRTWLRRGFRRRFHRRLEALLETHFVFPGLEAFLNFLGRQFSLWLIGTKCFVKGDQGVNSIECLFENGSNY